MTHLSNPFRKMEGYNCFGCSPENKIGLRLAFSEEGEELTADWEPSDHYQGYHGVLHGGIQATLLDEIASWVVYVKLKRAGVTSSINIRYLKTVYIKDGTLHVHAKVRQMRRNLADIETRLVNNKGEVCAEGIVTYFTFTEDKSKEFLDFPGHEDFYR